MRIRVRGLREQFEDTAETKSSYERWLDSGGTEPSPDISRIRCILADMQIVPKEADAEMFYGPVDLYLMLGRDLPADTQLGDEFEVTLTRISP